MERFEIGSRRRCDNDGKFYTVRTGRHRFCSVNCRAAFHRYGTPFLQLRPLIRKEIEQALIELEFRLFQIFDQNSEDRYRRRFPERARIFDELQAIETRANEERAS